jgi:deazaflavin-dependent oxidoreductase (nitroreductase family)
VNDRASIRYADAPFAWLTTTGRRTGLPRTVELWFTLLGGSIYFLAGDGERADWIRNARAQPQVSVRLGATDYPGTARTPEPGSDEDLAARQSIAAKYQGWREGRPLSRWAATATCLAVDLDF